jgi:phytoene synthase
VAASARAGEPDRYLAALLAPPSGRSALVALAAFSAELASIGRMVTREPAMGEIRLRWWRDALALPEPQHTGNPVADALRTGFRRHGLTLRSLVVIIDARALDLYADSITSDQALRDYLADTEGVLFMLAAQIIGGSADQELERASAHAGFAYGMTRLLLRLSHAAARGRLPLPLTRLAAAGVTTDAILAGAAIKKTVALIREFCVDARQSLVLARQNVSNLPRKVRPAFLPLALVEPYLRAVEQPGRDPVRDVAELVPLTRVLRMAVAHWRGRP